MRKLNSTIVHSSFISQLSFLENSMRKLICFFMICGVFGGYSFGQMTTVTIYEADLSDEYANYYKIIELRGKDSSSIEIRFFKNDRGNKLMNSKSKTEMILSGEMVYLLEKFVVKYFEWRKLEEARDTKIEREMYNKKGSTKVYASHNYRVGDYNTSMNSNGCDSKYGTFSAMYVGGEYPSLNLKYTCEGSASFRLSSLELNILKDYYSSGKFDADIKNIINSEENWDEFVPIDD